MFTPKPFIAAQKILRSVFYGKPSVFAEVDINAQILRQVYSLRDLNKSVGLLGSFEATDLSSYTGASNNLNMNITWVATSVIFNSMQFSIAAGGATALIALPNFPQVRFYLIAKKKTIKYTDDAVLSGLSGTTFPGSLPGAEHEIYAEERVGYGVDANYLPTLTSGEEIICPLGSIIPTKTGVNNAQVPTFYSHTLSAYSKKIKTLLGIQSFDAVSMVELNQYLADFLFNKRADPLGSIKMFCGNPSGRFDPSGLGLGEWSGWAYTNGANGTVDFRDRSPICYDDRVSDPANGTWDAGYNTITNVLGEKMHTMSVAELAAHNHTFQLNENNSGNSQNFPAVTDNFNIGVSTGTTANTGNGQPFNVVHPVFVTMFVQRIF